MDFVNNDTRQIAKNLLGVKVIYQDTTQTYTGYIVETEAYLGLNDRAAHGYGGKITPKVTSLYKRGGTIYAHVMHTHLLINFEQDLKVYLKAYLSAQLNQKKVYPLCSVTEVRKATR